MHRDIVQAAEHAERIAVTVELPEKVHFVRARKLVRDALRADGIANRIDQLVARVLGVAGKGS